MIVTIDGPAGAGKSTVARRLAMRLGFQFLDTGAMYRCCVLAAQKASVAWDDVQQLIQVVKQASIEVRGNSFFLDGDDVTEDIRAPEVGKVIHHIADEPEIRQELVSLQRKFAHQQEDAGQSIVTEGRDQGTDAFPDADCKIFLTASAHERAKRRLGELAEKGESMTLDEVLADQNERDERDENRPVGALRRAEDALVVVTDGMTLADVTAHLEYLVQRTQAAQK